MTSTEIRDGLSLMKVSDCDYHTEHDMSTDGLDLTITEALAEIEDVDPVTLIDDFSEYVDPDALNRLFRVKPDGEHRHLAGRLHMTIHGVDVTVHADGEIEIGV